MLKLIMVLLFLFFVYMYVTFVFEAFNYGLQLSEIWTSLSLEQQTLININYGFVDLKIVFTSFLLLFWIKVYRENT